MVFRNIKAVKKKAIKNFFIINKAFLAKRNINNLIIKIISYYNIGYNNAFPVFL